MVAVDIDTAAMQAKGLTPVDMVNAISAQNLILPSGTAKIGTLQYQVAMNGGPKTITEINDLPVKRRTERRFTCAMWPMSATAFRRRPNGPPGGMRGTLMTVMKNGGAPRWTSSTTSRPR